MATELATDKRMLDSKKFRIALIGSGCVMLVFFATIAVFAQWPTVAQHAQSLATTTIGFFLAVISVLITGQSAVEWSQSNALESKMSDERRTETERTEHVVIQGEPGAPLRRPFSPITPEDEHGN